MITRRYHVRCDRCGTECPDSTRPTIRAARAAAAATPGWGRVRDTHTCPHCRAIHTEAVTNHAAAITSDRTGATRA